MSIGTQLGPDFARAVAYAVDAHGSQRRKSTQIPYAAHLLAVSALVLEAGGSEVQAIAALLHDAPEDCGGQPRLDDIKSRFGPEVGRIVKACSDSLTEDPTDKPPWKERKLAYLEHLADRGTDADVLLVSLADKLHNAGAILRDLRAIGPEVFSRFNTGQADTLWYYRQLVETFTNRRVALTAGARVFLDEFTRTVEAIENEAQQVTSRAMS